MGFPRRAGALRALAAAASLCVSTCGGERASVEPTILPGELALVTNSPVCTSTHQVGSRVEMEVMRPVFGERGTEPRVVDGERRPVSALVEVVASRPDSIDRTRGVASQGSLAFALLSVTNGRIVREVGRLPARIDVHEMSGEVGGHRCLPKWGAISVTLPDSVSLIGQ